MSEARRPRRAAGELARLAGLIASITGFATACHDAPAPELAGCSKDTDCKGERICQSRACVDPPHPSISPPGSSDPESTSAKPRPAPEPQAPTTAQPAPSPQPPPEPRVDPASPSTTGERAERCGCPPDDLMCAMKCAQRGNAADPSTWPAEPQP